jgi:hypothetical protein
MKREAKLLLEKACDALVLSIELFNRPHDRGRLSSTLIQLDHGFEMLMKAAILHRGGRIREKRAKETIGFDACVRRSLSDGKIKYLSEEQALVLQTINGLRDAAQHHLLDISEGQSVRARAVGRHALPGPAEERLRPRACYPPAGPRAPGLDVAAHGPGDAVRFRDRRDQEASEAGPAKAA